MTDKDSRWAPQAVDNDGGRVGETKKAFIHGSFSGSTGFKQIISGRYFSWL